MRYVATIVRRIGSTVHLHHAQIEADNLAEAIGIATLAGHNIGNAASVEVKVTLLDSLDVIIDPSRASLTPG